MSIKNAISIGRVDSGLNFLKDKGREYRKKLIRLYSKRSKKENEKILLVSAKKGYVFCEGQETKISDFFGYVEANKYKSIAVLTRKERNFLLEIATYFRIKVYVLEDLYPFFKKIVYSKNLRKNLVEIEKYIKILNIKSVDDLSRRKVSEVFRHKIERKLRTKNNLDDLLYFTYQSPFQEVFKFIEERPGREIIVLDFNSMFADNISCSFPDPKKLKFREFNTKVLSFDGFDDGFYLVDLVNLKNKDFAKIHPFKFSRLNKKFPFKLKIGDSLKIFLPKEEIVFLSKFFEEVHVEIGIYSSQSTFHPLLVDVIKLHEAKIKAGSDGSLSNLIKHVMTTAYSAANPKRFKVCEFESLDLILEYLESYYFFERDDALTLEQNLDCLITSGLIEIENNRSTYKLRFLRWENNESVYTYFSKMISNSRVKIITLILDLVKVPTLELCYVNVDSVHVSIDKNLRNCLDSVLANYLGSGIGELKIEAVGNRGYWFDLGRYWIFNDDSIVKFSNYLFNRRFDKKIFRKSSFIYKVKRFNGVNYVVKYSLNIFDTFNSKKYLVNKLDMFDTVDFERYDFQDVCKASVASLTANKEKLQSFKLKADLFTRLSTDECSSNLAPKK